MYNTWIQKDDGSYYFVTTYKTTGFDNFTFYKPATQTNSDIYTKPIRDPEKFFTRCKPKDLEIDSYDKHTMIWELFRIASM